MRLTKRLFGHLTTHALQPVTALSSRWVSLYLFPGISQVTVRVDILLSVGLALDVGKCPGLCTLLC